MSDGIIGTKGTTFGAWLKQHRKEQGVGPDALAGQIGCSTIALLKIEAAERRPSRQMALLLAQALQVPADEQEAFVAFARTGQAVSVSSEGDTPSGLSAARSPWRATPLHRTNLPHLLTPLIGRERDEEQACALLRNPKVRLLTLTGAPGIGKTRLALQVASDVLDHFEDGVFLVELAPVGDPAEVLAAVARTLGLKESSGQQTEEMLLGYTRERRMLLVLDNLEHLLDATPSIVMLLEGSPWLKVLVTSREALHVRGERRYSVPPLAIPDKTHLPTTETLASYPSVELFVERAQAIAPDFELTAENAQEIATICIGLDGLPLAIELAAAHARHLSLGEMKQALGRPLRLLTGGGRDLPPRQRTLRSAIEWSYSLLDEVEQTSFRKLGVFVGGFTLEAAEIICKEKNEQLSVRSIVESLADKSLLKDAGETAGGGSPTTRARFGMLETLREYALEQLAARGEEAQIRRRHAACFLALAEAAEPELKGANQREWLAYLGEEYDNLQAALGWSLGPGDDVETALRLTSALWRFWFAHGNAGEGRRWLEIALARSQNIPQAIRAQALDVAGVLARVQGDHSAARPLIEESLALHRELENKPGIARALNDLGVVIRALGAYAQSRVLFEESLAIHEELGDKHGISDALNSLGIVARTLDDQNAAYAFFEKSLMLRRDVGDKLAIAVSLMNLGLVVQDLGDLARANALHEESQALRRDLGDQVGIAMSLNFLGHIALARGDYARACVFSEESLAMNRELGNKQGIADAFDSMGKAEYFMGNHKRGYALLGKAISLYGEIGEQGSVAVALYTLGTLFYDQGDDKAAQARFDESLVMQKALGDKAGEAVALDGLGLVALHQGDFAAARLYQEEALDICRELGHAINLARVLASAAARAVEEEDYVSAHSLYAEALPLLQQTGNEKVIADCFEGIAVISYKQGRPIDAARQWGTAAGIREAISHPIAETDRARYECRVAEARSQGGDVAFDAAWGEGRAMSMGEALAYALDSEVLLGPMS